MGNNQNIDSDNSASLSMQKRFKACLSHADDLLQAANKVLLDVKLPNIAFHLAVLALEEVGKALLLFMNCQAKTHDKDFPEKHLQDHVKKLFWAIWSPSFDRGNITKEEIEVNQGLAKTLHDMRLRGLYVSVSEEDTPLPKDVIKHSEAENLIKLATARVRIEQNNKLKHLNEKDKKTLSWFMEATEDKEKLNLIFGNKSIEKLSELGQIHKWVDWLKEQFDQEEEENRKLLEREIMRCQSNGKDDDSEIEKWRFQVRLFTNSHSIRQIPLNWWNGVSSWLKLTSVSNKKNQILVEFTISKKVTVDSLFYVGWNVARKFVLSLNIGSCGYFWWYLPEQTKRFYEKLKDLESKKNLSVEISPPIELNWKRDVLSEKDLRNIGLCFGVLSKANDLNSINAFNHYISGLALLGKNDIHLRFETNAFMEFYKCLKKVMLLYNDWDQTKQTIKEACELSMSNYLNGSLDIINCVSMGEEIILKNQVSKEINLNEVIKMKMICDNYLMGKFIQIIKKR